MGERSFANISTFDGPAKDHLLAVANFLGWFDPDHVQGGVRAEQAFESFCALLDIPRGRLLNIVRGNPQQDLADAPR